MQSFWNERYNQDKYVYGEKPNEFFSEQLAKLPKKGKILLPAEGEGRNAIFAAMQGWTVKAFDYSEEGRKKAMKLAQKYKVRIDYELTDAQEFRSNDLFDVIALIYGHFADEERKFLFRKLGNLLVPGGLLIMEVFSKNQLGRDSGGPKDVELLYSIDEIRELLPNLEYIMLEETEIRLDEGNLHQGKASVIRVLAQKV